MVRHDATRSLQTVASILVVVGLVAGTEIATTASAIAAEIPVSPSAVFTAPSQVENQLLAASPATVPPEIIKTLRQDLSKRTGIPLGQLRYTEGTSRTWQDGCLGLGRLDEICAQMLVNGWRVVFANGSNRWVYRTDANGRTYRLEPSNNRSEALPELPKPVSSLRPNRIPANELPPKLQKNAVFRAIASGGFAGQTYQTTLYQDGRLVREQLRPNGTSGSSQVRQVSQQQVRQFIAMLRQNKLYRFHRADYPATPGSADFFTVTLSCQFCTIRYSDSIQAELPGNLQTVIQAWNELTRIV